ncbi:MAG: pyridoxal 5'-phosphate synthase glutaminase subunit PdxT [Chloroflexota bacterium]|nr:pyridoxal 5'-phosphate synthase glutaminase subunit PdxT [Chloroflexota bacterium]MDE2898159.1 pyridoxal 5'-phosphate synthase glutaminase subunit PdxT [Chloroflexota bacterium]
MSVRIGVLALQGDFAEHGAMLGRLDAEPVEVRQTSDMDGIAGLIIPGGESTTIGKLMERYGFREPIRDLAQSGKPIWGTCAGLILMARDVGRCQPLLNLLDITVERNAFGRQTDSFETDLEIEGISGGPFPAVFIRAPVVRDVGPGVQVLSRLEDGTIVAVRRGRLFGTAFHPELTGDTRLHASFVEMARQA